MENAKHVILYIEDDEDYRAAVRTILESNGYAMIEATTAEEGLKVFQAENPDLVIVDLMMEEVDAGTNLVKDLKAAGADVPIYMLSSVGDKLNMTTDFAALGLAGIFQKPIDAKRLIKILNAKLN